MSEKAPTPHAAWKKWGLWAIVATLVVVTALGVKSPPRPPIVGEGEPELVEGKHATGWVQDDAAVKAVADVLPFRVFGDTPAGRADDPLPNQVYLWDAYRKMFARPPPAKNQNPVGSCVSFGTNNAIERTMAVDIAIAGKAFEFKHIVEEVTYAGSRVEIGGGRIRGDGSVGAWAAKFVQQYGVVAREVHGKYDLREYSPTRCREWGRAGVPADLEPLAREHPVQEITLVRNWAEAKRALANGYGIAICSGQGFRMQRDSRGVCKPSGSWSHCMALDGYHVDGGAEFGHIENSWGESAHTGPVGWGNPSTAGFWAESKVIDRMLRAGDSWAFSGVKGFPARKLDWFVRQPERRRPLWEVASLGGYPPVATGGLTAGRRSCDWEVRYWLAP